MVNIDSLLTLNKMEKMLSLSGAGGRRDPQTDEDVFKQLLSLCG